MKDYIIRRLVALVPTLIISTMLVFFCIRIVPGDVIDLMVENSNSNDVEITRATLMKDMGLDQPIYVQYFRWIKGIVIHGEFGTSLWDQSRLMDEVARRVSVSIELASISLLLAVIIGVSIGILSAIRQETGIDYIARSFSMLSLSTPAFWIGTMVVVLPSIYWGWSPPIEIVSFMDDPSKNLQKFLPPAIIMGLVISASIMRMTRAMMLEVLRQDYIRTAWAKGLKEHVVVLRHALKNALIPVVTLIGLLIPDLVAGLVVMEEIFALPGLGSFIFQSIEMRDYPFVIGLMLLMALFIMGINLLVDLSYGLLDPKVKFK